ncbi:MAG: short-chain dehydrogenase/reductase [Pseudomonas sp.]|nr:short-chain dehydrogenase/reductase [Pseudomonas sp.]
MSSSISYNRRSTAEYVLADVDLSGKNMLLTGCSSGIGLETMRVLANHGAHVIGLARSAVTARNTCAKLGIQATIIECEMSDLDSVWRAIDSIRGLGKSLDAIITNAGIAAPHSLEVLYGVEKQFLVNYLSHFLLVTQLLDIVPDHTGRIVVGSSSASIGQAPKEGIQFNNLDGHEAYKPFAFYGQSKLATALFAKALSQRLQQRQIAVNSVHPGATRGTGLNASLPVPLKLVLSVAQWFMKSVQQGAATQVLLAGSAQVQGVTGHYWADCQPAIGPALLDDQILIDQLWAVSEDLLRLHSTQQS